MTISWCRCVLDMAFKYLTFSASPINSRTKKATLRCGPLSPHLSASTGRCLSGLTIDSCTMPLLPAQQSLSKPDGKLVPIVQKQCGRLMTDAQGVQRRQRWALVWTEVFFLFFFFQRDVSCFVLPHWVSKGQLGIIILTSRGPPF